MKASDLFVRCLEEEGIEYIFGVPGEENADFMMSLEASSKIKFVLTRHEQGAAFMAEVYGRLTGNPAGCLGTLGPGATNLITGVADSNMDRAPMLVLTGQGATTRLHKESHQIMDVVEMFTPVTKWATTILDGSTIPEITRKAVRVARTEKPGAVHIELPEDVAKDQTDVLPLPVKRFRRSVPDDKISIVDCKINSILGPESHRIQTIVSIQIHCPLGHERADNADSRLLTKPSKLSACTPSNATIASDDDGSFCCTN